MTQSLVLPGQEAPGPPLPQVRNPLYHVDLNCHVDCQTDNVPKQRDTSFRLLLLFHPLVSSSSSSSSSLSSLSSSSSSRYGRAARTADPGTAPAVPLRLGPLRPVQSALTDAYCIVSTRTAECTEPTGTACHTDLCVLHTAQRTDDLRVGHSVLW
eukprot:3691231-Rhodomonas_salina.1